MHIIVKVFLPLFIRKRLLLLAFVSIDASRMRRSMVGIRIDIKRSRILCDCLKNASVAGFRVYRCESFAVSVEFR